MLEVEIHQIRVGRDGSPERCLILRPKDHEDRRICPIIIGPSEAQAIVAPSTDPVVTRPMTHDLLLNSINELGGTVQYIYIRALEKATFFADVNIKIGDDEVALDARPSDSIALAVRARVPIYMADEVLEQVNADLQVRATSEEPRRAPSGGREYEEATPVTPEQREKLSAFSELMETLSMDEDGEETVKS